MRQVLSRIVFVLALALMSSQDATATLGANDTRAPVIQSVTVSPATITAGASVTVTARITDDISGVRSASVGYNLPNGAFGPQASFSLLSGTALDGIYRATITIPVTYASGVYTLGFVYAEDAATNHAYTSSPPLPAASFTVFDASPPISIPQPLPRSTAAPNGNPAPVPAPRPSASSASGGSVNPMPPRH